MPTSSFWNHPIEKLEEAVSIRKQIATLQAKLSSIFGGSEKEASPKASKGTRGGKRIMSAEARARISAAQKARWAKSNGASSTTSSTASDAPATAKSKAVSGKVAKPAKVKRTLSPEARAKISAAAKKRWADVKKADK